MSNLPEFKNAASRARYFLTKFSYQEIKDMRHGNWFAFYKVIEKYGWHLLEYCKQEDRAKLQLIKDFLYWHEKDEERKKKEAKQQAKKDQLKLF